MRSSGRDTRRLVTAELQRRYLGGHMGLRRVLGSYLACDPSEVMLQTADGGKPGLADGRLSFNLAHSGGDIVLAIGAMQVGVDIEVVRALTNIESLAAKHCTDDEQQVLHSLHGTQRLRAFFSVWTRKEAVLKLFGAGLQKVLAELDVGLADEECTPIEIPLRWYGEQRRCWLASGAPTESLEAAVATVAPIEHCVVYTATRW